MLFRAAILSTLLSIGSEAGANNNEGTLTAALRQGSSQGFNQVREQVVGRSLNVQPTITIRPGFPVRVIVNRDLVPEPYAGRRGKKCRGSSSARSKTTSRLGSQLSCRRRFTAISSPMRKFWHVRRRNARSSLPN